MKCGLWDQRREFLVLPTFSSLEFRQLHVASACSIGPCGSHLAPTDGSHGHRGPIEVHPDCGCRRAPPKSRSKGRSVPGRKPVLGDRPRGSRGREFQDLQGAAAGCRPGEELVKQLRLKAPAGRVPFAQEGLSFSSVRALH